MRQQHLSRNQRERQVIETRQREKWLEEQAAKKEELQADRDSERPERAAPPERRNQAPTKER